LEPDNSGEVAPISHKINGSNYQAGIIFSAEYQTKHFRAYLL